MIGKGYYSSVDASKNFRSNETENVTAYGQTQVIKVVAHAAVRKATPAGKRETSKQVSKLVSE